MSNIFDNENSINYKKQFLKSCICVIKKLNITQADTMSNGIR